MTVADIMSSAVYAQFGRLGVSVTYRPKNGLPKTINVLRGLGEGDEYEGADDFGMADEIGIQVADIAKPVAGDEIDITTTAPLFDTWEVLYARPDSAWLMWIVKINLKKTID